jgi:hypothetical protein
LWAEVDSGLRERESKDQSREEKRVLATLWFEEELRNKLILGCKKLLVRFSFKMINGADE